MRVKKQRTVFFISLLATLIGPRVCHAVSLPSLNGALDNIFGLAEHNVMNAVIPLVGITFDHRPLEPASPLGTSLGLDLGVEVDLVQVPSHVKDTLATQGINVGSVPVLPNLREINLHKGLGKSVDIGGSVLSYQGYLIWAAEIKVVLFNPEEGLCWALRMSRTSVHIPIGSTNVQGVDIDVNVDVTTYTPELVISKKLDYFEPYFGGGYQYVTGGLNISNSAGITVPGLDSINGSGGSPLLFIGLSMKAPVVGLRITLEGTYSTGGFNALGTKVGFSF